jgi:putative oxidoreductase
MRYAVLVGRALYVMPFLLSPMIHFSPNGVAYAAQQGVPLPSLLVPLSGVLALAGGVSVLLGYKATIGAWLLVAFLGPVTFLMHPFWAVTDQMMMQVQMAMFSKNLALLGAALLVAHFGTGPLSLDARAGAGAPATPR